MRKRTKYQKPKAKNKIPTLIIMCVTLFVILFFGKNISNSVAGLFAPNVPVTDAPIVAVQGDMPDVTNQNADIPRNAGVAVAQANKNAAQNLLKLLSKGQ